MNLGEKTGESYECKIPAADRAGPAIYLREAASGGPGERRNLLPALYRKPYPVKKCRESSLESVRDPRGAIEKECRLLLFFLQVQPTISVPTYTNEEGSNDKTGHAIFSFSSSPSAVFSKAAIRRSEWPVWPLWIVLSLGPVLAVGYCQFFVRPQRSISTITKGAHARFPIPHASARSHAIESQSERIVQLRPADEFSRQQSAESARSRCFGPRTGGRSSSFCATLRLAQKANLFALPPHGRKHRRGRGFDAGGVPAAT